MPKGCPECPLTDTFNYFKGRCATEAFLRYGDGGEDEKWPFDVSLTDVLETYSTVRRLLDDNDEKINPGWDDAIARLARIILSERSQARLGDEFEGSY